MDPLAQNVARKFVEAGGEASPPKKILFTSIVLNEASHNELIAWWKKNTDTPLLAKVVAHHMTIKFKPTAEEAEATPVGTKASMKVIGWAADEKSQAVLVVPQLPSGNKHPHVTVSTAAGVDPAYSNDLLAQGYNRVSGPTLTGIVEAGS